MFRRSRFSVRPNVSTGGRAAAASQEAPSASQEAGETPKDASESNSAAPVTDNKADLTTTEKSPAPGDGSDQTGEGSSSSAAVQRRKRFSIKPKVAPGRAALARAAKSPAKAAAESSGSDLDKPTTSSQTTAAPQGLQSPRRRRPSEENKQPTIQPKPIAISSESPGLSSVPLAEDSLAETPPPGDSSKEVEIISDTQVKDVPPKQPEVPPSLPDKEAFEISEKARTLVSSKGLLPQTSSAFTLSRLLNDPSDLHRLAKAQKLRELLRKEMCKEKKIKKIKMFPKEYTLDPAKMTMSDLIRYLPTSNPMTSSLEDSGQENETVVPPSPGREESPERAQEPEELPTTVSSTGEVDEEAEEEDDDALMVPRVKVAEDGSLIIDEESLTVEVQRAKGPNPAHNRDPIFERGSTTTYSSFRKGTYSKPWSSEETDMFFLAINMVGTDFSMICQLFPHRARSEIKNKFKKEERGNAWRIDKAFKERRKLDIEYFSKLLEKILEYQKNKKKLKSLAQKNSPKKNKKKEKGVKKPAKKRDDVQVEGEANENQVPNLEKEGEKENEDLCNEGETPDAKPKRKRKTKTKADALTEEPDGKKKKVDERGNEQGEAGIPEDVEAALPEDQTNSDMSEKIQEENTDKDTSVKPAKLTRGRAPKPLLPLGRKWGKKPPPSTEEAKDTPSDKGDESVGDGASEEQANDASPLSQANMKKSGNDDISSEEEEEDATIKPLRPTRYGRVPKPTRLLNYPAKEDAHSSASETLPASPAGSTSTPAKLKPKATAKRAMSSKQQSTPKSKKPKLVTLRASQSESSDEDIETPWLNEELVEEQQLACSPGKDSSAPVFVPASLHTPQPVISEVDETMVELDILASMPDVLGMSQDVLCPNSSCEEAHGAGTAEPCEHQLDLLVDVIDFLSSEHTEVTEDESYNEAAQTLLTIGNLAHLAQSAQNQTVIQDDGAVTASAAVDETSQLEEEIASKPVAQEGYDTTSVSTAAGQEVTEMSVACVELQDTITECGDILIVKTSDPKCDEQTTVCDPSPQVHSEPESSSKDSPQAKKGRLSKVKPKPNLSRSSRTAQSKSQPETSAVRTAEESHSFAASLSEASAALATADETTSKIPDCAPALVKDDVSCAAELTDEPSDSQRRLFDQAESDAVTADENSSEIHSLHHSESQFDPSKDEASRDTKPASESSNEKQKSCTGTPETGVSNPGTSDLAVIEFGQDSCTDSVPVQGSSNKPPPTEDLSLTQIGESEVGTAFQSRRGRLPKGKPKPNLPQTSRTVRSKPHSSVKEDSGPTSSPKSHKESITEVEPQPTGASTLEKENESIDTASASKASLNLDSTLTATKETATKEEKTACVKLVNPLELGATTCENQELSKAPIEASKEQATRDAGSTCEYADENLTSHTETISNNVVTTVSESQGGPGSNVVSGSVEEVGAMFVKPAEELPVRQEEGEGASAGQPKRSRSQKVKPKPNLPQTTRASRSKPQSTKEVAEKDPIPTPNPQSNKETIEEVEPQTTYSPTPEKESECVDPFSVSKASLNLDSAFVSSEEVFTNEDKAAYVEPFDVVELGVSEKQNFSEAQFLPNREVASIDTSSTSECTDKSLTSHIETSNNVETTDSAVTESQVGEWSNIVSGSAQEVGGHPATFVKPAVELPVRQEEGEGASACQPKRSRLQKVKPKPNLPQTTRATRSKPQSAKEVVEKDPIPAPNPQCNKETIEEVKPQTTYSPTPEKESECVDPFSVSKVSLNLDSAFVSSEEVCANEDKAAYVEPFDAVELGVSEKQNFSEAQFLASIDTGSTSECTDKSLTSHVETSNNVETTDSAVTESQVGEWSDIVSASVREGLSGHQATFVKPAVELPVRQEEGEGASACQPKRSRLQKVKPKPNLPQTTRTPRSKPQSTKEVVEKDPIPAPNPQCHKETIEEVEPQTTYSPTPEKESECVDPFSVSKTSLNLDSAFVSSEEVCTIEEKTGYVEPVDEVELGASEKQNFSEAQFLPSRELASIDTGSTSERTDENLTYHVETIRNNVETTDSAVTESQVGDIVSGSVQEVGAMFVKPAEELTVRQEEGEGASAGRPKRSRLQKVKPKPNLPQTTRTTRSKPQSTKDQFVEKPHSPTPIPESTDHPEVEAQPTSDTTPQEKSNQITTPSPASISAPPLDVRPTHECTKELSSAKDLNTDVGCEPASSSVVSEQNVPQRKRWFPKVKPKPNLGSSTRTALTKKESGDPTKPSEHIETTSYVKAENKVGDDNIAQTDVELTEKDIKHLTTVHGPFDAELSSINVGSVDSERVPDSTNDEVMSSGVVMDTSRVAEKQSVLTESVLVSKSTKESSVETTSTQDRMSKCDPEEAGPSSQEDNKLDTSNAESCTQQINDPSPVSDMESSKDGSMASLTTNASPVCLEKDSSVQSETESELTDSKNSRKAPQARRGRLIKPKPNLVRASRPPQARKVQDTKAEAESSSCSAGMDASVDHKPVSDLGPDFQQSGTVIGELRSQDSPVSDAGSSLGCLARVTEHQSEHDTPSNDAQTSLGCVTEVSCTQSESTSSKEGIQSFPVLFQEMLPEELPSDPNEPFFILSLTEIPVSTSGEVVSGAAEHFSHLPVLDASLQQPGVSGESFTAGDGSFFYVPTEDGDTMDLISVKDTQPDLAASTVPPMEHPVDPHGSVTAQPAKSPEAADDDETTKQRRAGPGRTAKLQVKSRTARKKENSNTETAEEGETVTSTTNAAQDSEHPGVSVQPEAFDVAGLQKGSHVDADKKTGGKDPDTSSRDQTTQRTRAGVWSRKPKDFPSFLSETNNTAASSDSSPGTAASSESEGKTQHAEPSLASEARAVGLTLPSKTELDLNRTSGRSPSSSNPSTSQGTAEASASQQSDCVEVSSVEEPTNVSQYFLSDIFIEVDEE